MTNSLFGIFFKEGKIKEEKRKERKRREKKIVVVFNVWYNWWI